MASNLSHQEEEPQLLFDGRVVLTAGKNKNRRRIEDIVSWMEAFSIFSMVLTSFFPHRWKDLTSYKLLILRTYRQLSGPVWLAYDKAFREHAAATKLTDWSDINSQLFNFHAAGASAREPVGSGSSNSAEAKGSSSSDIVCHSWNRGSCTAPYAICKFAHLCSKCQGAHRERDCKGPSRSAFKRQDKFPAWSPQDDKRRR